MLVLCQYISKEVHVWSFVLEVDICPIKALTLKRLGLVLLTYTPLLVRQKLWGQCSVNVWSNSFVCPVFDEIVTACFTALGGGGGGGYNPKKPNATANFKFGTGFFGFFRFFSVFPFWPILTGLTASC